MALQSEVSPPIVGDPNKDTKNDGDTKSDDNDSTSTEEEVDLEEGEILDSGAEEEEKKDLTNSSLQEALDKNFLKSIEQLVSQAKTDGSPPNVAPKTLSPNNSPAKTNKRTKYIDHDHFESSSDQEAGWYSPSRNRKSKFDSKPIDYRKELDAYIGTPPSSPERKHKDEKKKRRSSKKSKKSVKKTIKRKDIKGERVNRYIKEAMKRKICKFYKEGKCSKGVDCGFSHSSPLSYKKRELCKFYLSGHCNKGNDCLYMHNEFPCKFYHTGSECYAQDACRFSHEPLTDEMKRVLADYLRMHHGDDDYERKRRRSPSPEAPPRPPPKRTCLLGSPPRHIREAEETKRWQEEMLHLQQGQHPGFKINIHGEEEGFPPPFQKPNFYQETLPDSPISQRRQNQEGHMFPPTPFGKRDIDERFSVPSASDIFVYEEDYQDNDDNDIDIKQEPQDFEWNDMPAVNHNMPPVKMEIQPYIVPARQELDFTSDVKFDEATQFSESSTDCVPHTSLKDVLQPPIKKEIEEDFSNQEIAKSEDCKTNDEPLPPTLEVAAVPIVVPSHLPKKQRELFMRIQQQELKHATIAAVSDASLSPKPFDSTDPPLREDAEEEKPEVKKIDESIWYSSDDDDDDDTEPLTNVLKNLQKEPPVMQPVKTDPKPAQDLMAMLNRIQQKALEKNKGISESDQGGSFFQNLLGTLSAPVENLSLPGLNLPPPEFIRRTLLPDPKSIPPVKMEPVVPPKDPRLKNRDPRLAAAATTTACLPKAAEPAVPQKSSSLPRPGLKTPTFVNPVVASPESVKEEIPYKLHGIYTKPPNYASYITASQNNPSLLKDPRLRKHMNLAQNKINGDENIKEVINPLKAPAKNAPPIPELLLKYNKNETLAINIFESNPPTKPTSENIPECKPQLPKLLDPRVRRRESQNSSGSNTPPHLSIVESPPPPIVGSFKAAPPILEREVKPAEEKKWLPPVLEKSWTPPILEQSWTPPIKQEVDSDEEDNYKTLRLQIDESPPSTSDQVIGSSSSVNNSIKKKPTPASHLPRAIADPRMAKLQNPLHSRRSPRLSTVETSNKSPPELVKLSTLPPNENSSDSSRLSPVDSADSEPVNSKSTVSKLKKNKLSEEKKKTVHRNRKSSMDYASPLNSCDDSSNKSLNYNRYNQRPKRTCVLKSMLESSVSSVTTNSVVGDTTPDFLSDNSNLDCENSSDVNLKDMFKTIDPTASPFC